jgi:hypothetical protein
MARPELEIDDLEAKIPAINEANAAYAEGDHWQNGAGYTGPRLPTDHVLYNNWLTEMERIFVSRDILREIRLRERWALTGKAWTYKLEDADGNPLAEAESLELSKFIDKWIMNKQIISTVADAIENSSWSGDEGVDGRGLLRFYIPEQRLEGGRAQAEDLGDALNLIELESPDSATAVVFEDADGGYEKVGFISWQEEKAGEEFDRAELVYTNDQGMTVLESLLASDAVSAGTVELNLLGKLTMYQLERPLLITSSQRSMQRFLNHTMTAFQAAIGGAAWPEDFFFGLLPPGEWVENSNGELEFIPQPLERGPGRSHFLQVATTVDQEDTEKALAGGGHTRTSTVSPHLFTEAGKDITGNMFASAFQEYTLLTGLAQASGEKLQLAKGDFEASATDMANETRLMVSRVIETAIALAEAISGGGEPSGIQANVTVQIDTGKVTIEQKLLLSQLRTDKFIPHETALAEAGYPDPAGEIEAIVQAFEDAAARGMPGVAPGNVDAAGGTDEGTDLDTEKNEVETPTASTVT